LVLQHCFDGDRGGVVPPGGETPGGSLPLLRSRAAPAHRRGCALLPTLAFQRGYRGVGSGFRRTVAARGRLERPPGGLRADGLARVETAPLLLAGESP